MSVVRKLLARMGMAVDESGFKKADSKIQGLKSGLESAARSASGLATKITAAVGAVAGFSAVKSIVQANLEIEGLKASLVGVEGSTDAANKKWEELKRLARETPFQLGQVTTAYSRMANLGLDASDEMITAFGDISAAIPGKNVLDFVEAVADATTGEMERLKEFGIKAKKEGKNVTLTFGDMSVKVKNDSKSIQDALKQIAQAKFGGTMERQMDTLGGRFSNLKDVAFQFAEAVGEAGLSDAMRRLTDLMIQWTQSADGLAVKLGQGLGTAVNGLANSMELLARHSEEAKGALAGVAGFIAVQKIASFVGVIVSGVGALVPVITGIAGAVSLIGTILSVVISPAGAVLAVVFTAIAGFVNGVLEGMGGLAGVMEIVIELSDSVMVAFQAMFGGLTEGLTVVGEALYNYVFVPFQAIGVIVGKILAWLAGPVGAAIEFIGEVLGVVFEIIGEILAVGLELFGAVIEPIVTAITVVFDLLMAGFKAIKMALEKLGILDFIVTVWDTIKQVFGMFRDAWEGITSFVRDLAAMMLNPLLWALEGLVDMIKGIIGMIPDSFLSDDLKAFAESETDFQIKTSEEIAMEGYDRNIREELAIAGAAMNIPQVDLTGIRGEIGGMLKGSGGVKTGDVNVQIMGNPNGTPSEIGRSTRDGVLEGFDGITAQVGDIQPVEF